MEPSEPPAPSEAAAAAAAAAAKDPGRDGGGDDGDAQPPPPPKQEEPAAAAAAAAAAAPAEGGAEKAESAEQASSSRVIYGKDVAQETDEVQYKWNAIFYNFTPEQKAKLALDEVSMYSITDTRSANNTSKILQRLVGGRATITDGCAAAGGNTLSFAEHFARVQAVELDDQRYGLLEHNVRAMGLQGRVSTHHGDCLQLLPQLQQDVVFLDPPWGGKSYSDADTVDLTFAGLPLAEACERLKPHCRYIALKLPLNFNLDGLRRRVTSSVLRADDRCARKQLFVVLDTSGEEHHRQGQGGGGQGRGFGGGGGGRGRGFKRHRDDREKPWTIKRKT